MAVTNKYDNVPGNQPGTAEATTIAQEKAHAYGQQAGTAALSTRELQVLRFLALGCSDKDIAQRLGLSARTVHSHVNHVVLKLHAHNRTHAAALAVQSGLLKLRTATLSAQTPVALGFDCRRKASHSHVA